MPDLIDYRTADRIAWITLDRPDKRNALGPELVAALKAALARAAADEHVRVVVLGGAGKAFSAGADLASLQALQTASDEENLADSRRLADLFEQIHLHSKPVIAIIKGAAIAGGCGLAAVCDFSVAEEGARFGFTEVRIGFVPAIVMVFVLRKLGEAAARDLFLRGGLIDARQAEAIGLITRAVPAEQLDDHVRALALEIATETSASAVALTKQMLARVPGMSLAEALDYAAQMNAAARATPDCRAGVAAFLRKEPPPWRREASRAGERDL